MPHYHGVVSKYGFASSVVKVESCPVYSPHLDVLVNGDIARAYTFIVTGGMLVTGDNACVYIKICIYVCVLYTHKHTYISLEGFCVLICCFLIEAYNQTLETISFKN